MSHLFAGKRILAPLVGAILFMTAAYNLIPNDTPSSGADARVQNELHEITFTADSLRSIRFFDTEGRALVWYHKGERGAYELYDGPGRHPRYGTELAPMRAEVVKALEHQVATEKQASPMPRTTPAEGPAEARATPTAPLSPTPTTPPTVDLSFPAGTVVSVRLPQGIATDTSQPGDRLMAVLAEPLAQDGYVVADAGASVSIAVHDARCAEGDEPARLELKLGRLRTPTHEISLGGPTFIQEVKPPSKLKRILVGVGGAVTGAVVGGAADGKDGAKKGLIIGAGTGTAAALLMRGKSIRIPPDTVIRFQLPQPLTVQVNARGPQGG